MTVKRAGLGRNLSALLGQGSTLVAAKAPENAVATLHHLGVDALKPGQFQPRAEMDEERLEELTQSIRKQGLLQPIVVRPLPDGSHEILAGERRWRASMRAGLSEVPVVIRACDDETAMVIALVENLQREDLNAMDEARALHRLTAEFALTHQQVAELVGKSRASVSNHLRLLGLVEPVRLMLEHGDIDMGHARALLMLEPDKQAEAATLVIAKQLSVRETERLVSRIRDGHPESSPAKPSVAHHLEADLQKLSRSLNTRVVLRPGKQGKGTLVIHYHDEQRLVEVLDRLHGVAQG